MPQFTVISELGGGGKEGNEWMEEEEEEEEEEVDLEMISSIM